MQLATVTKDEIAKVVKKVRRLARGDNRYYFFVAVDANGVYATWYPSRYGRSPDEVHILTAHNSWIFASSHTQAVESAWAKYNLEKEASN